MSEMLSTREIAKFLNVNEKMVYSLIAEKGLPASKVTGKWIFPLNLVRQWVENGTENFPEIAKLPPYHGLVLIAGSNDLLLDKVISTFNIKHNDHIAMFGVSGSMGGLKALKQNFCHIAASHLVALGQCDSAGLSDLGNGSLCGRQWFLGCVCDGVDCGYRLYEV